MLKQISSWIITFSTIADQLQLEFANFVGFAFSDLYSRVAMSNLKRPSLTIGGLKKTKFTKKNKENFAKANK